MTATKDVNYDAIYKEDGSRGTPIDAIHQMAFALMMMKHEPKNKTHFDNGARLYQEYTKDRASHCITADLLAGEFNSFEAFIVFKISPYLEMAVEREVQQPKEFQRNKVHTWRAKEALGITTRFHFVPSKICGWFSPVLELDIAAQQEQDLQQYILNKAGFNTMEDAEKAFRQ